MKTFADEPGDEIARRFTADLESALLARALAGTGALPDEPRKALLHGWLLGTFHASAHGQHSIGEGRGALLWEADGTDYRLTWYSPTGLVCPLARIYRQADDTWAALIVAGVRGSAEEAMIAAEWGVSRLAA